MARTTLVVLNASQHDALFDPLRELAGDRLEVVHASYHVDWQEISRRRRGEPPAGPEAISDELVNALGRAVALFGFYVPRNLLALAPSLRWLETPSTGVDHLRGTGIAGSTITVTDGIKNVGGGTAGPSATRFYLSTNASFDASDMPLDARPVGTIDPGATDSGSTVLALPADLATATYFLIAVADGDAQVPETNEANNWRTLVISVTAAP